MKLQKTIHKDMQNFDGPSVEIDLAQLAHNYQQLRAHFTGTECAAVVKADAYGLGMNKVARALADAGCQTFCVATLPEGIALRSEIANRKIMVFAGVNEGEQMAFVNHQLVPVLNSPVQVARWRSVAQQVPNRPSILHADTGMARLGLTQSELAALPEDSAEACQFSLLMTHLACASEVDHPQNEAQLERFIAIAEQFPQLPTSLCNSGGIMLGEAYHDDLARPGCALYGINPTSGDASPSLPIAPVVRVSAPILQIRTLDAAQRVGYGATQELPKGSKIATIAIGYADGIHRQLSHQLCGYVVGVKVPLVGRVTMDLLSFDVSALTHHQLAAAQRIELINAQQTVNDVAKAADTIGYEILTSLGPRVKRIYRHWCED